VLRELVTRPVSAAIALIELPATVQRSLKQANELMETSRRQLEAMQHQTDEALHQAERMNDLLGRVVKLTEPLELAARGSEYVGGRLKRVLLGDDGTLERAVADAEAAAHDAETAAAEAEADAEAAAVEADAVAEEPDEGQ
jgi:F0F1-type ATP synthase membrane subunit b/b'